MSYCNANHCPYDINQPCEECEFYNEEIEGSED